ncbi:ATPase AAA [Sulfurovum lithotrophicum]|uniref:ATPase AAA n=1 Tax=Sulfurovum lithotrophicum TaxID=206403 RepID=A0A7U4M1P2_9BACT|nr:AAA family ATPase [Sulfurovum lithotrophicum]AKF25244.1 ATPase AAA [Sulfurovum lithotrophicum]
MTPREAIKLLFDRMNKEIIGQEHIVERFIMGMLADGNMLVEGLPGLAKTRAVRSMANAIEAKFSRIQFTPDLEPSDVVGEERVYEENGKRYYEFHEGPIFGNIILADEINRAPAKVQSALLEAMEEKQVTVAGVTRDLPELFVVLATQNPLEQKGTYPLPEAQKDRFLMHVKIDYVKMDDEYRMVKQVLNEGHRKEPYENRIPQQLIFGAREEVKTVEISEEMGKYMVELVFATRYPLRYSKQLEVMIEVGVSPRGSLALTKCAQVHAWMRGRREVTGEDVKSVIHDVFRHRLIKSEHTKFSGIENDEIIDIIIEHVPEPEVEFKRPS